MSGGPSSSPSLSRHGVKEWSQRTPDEKNAFLRCVVDSDRLAVSGERPTLLRTSSQSSLNSSSSSLVDMSEGDLALMTAAAQLTTGGRIKRQTSIRALVSSDKKLLEIPKSFDPSELPRYESGELCFQEEEGRLKVKKASAASLCSLLLDPRGVDFDFETTFFLTFPLFLSTEYFLTFFAKHLCDDADSIILPSPLSSSSSSSSSSLPSSLSISRRSDAVKEKARSSLSHWVHLVPDDFLDDSGKVLLSQVNSLVTLLSFSPLIPIPPTSSSSVVSASPHFGGEVTKGDAINSPSLRLSTESLSEMVKARKRSLTLKKKGKREGEEVKRKGSLPSIPSQHLASSLLLWSPLLLAQQLTAASWYWFERISAREWLSSSWGAKEMNEQLVPSIYNLIIEFNFTHLWAVSEILLPFDEGERAIVIEKMIDVLAECILLQNYQSSLALFSALSATPVERLSRSWKGVSQRAMKSFQSSSDLLKMEGNFAALRSVIYSVSPPLMPYIGIPMGDLTAIQQVELITDGLVNFDQCDVMGRVIAHIRHCQSSPYPYKVIPEFLSLRGRRRVLDEKEAFALSQEREGGERKGGGDSKGIRSSGGERRKSIPSVSLMATSPSRPSALKMCTSEPALSPLEIKEGEDKEGVYQEEFGRNPYTSRFTKEQLVTLAAFSRERGGERVECEDVDAMGFFIRKKKDPTKEDMETLRNDLGPRGAGGILLSSQIVLNWMNYE